MKQFLFLFVLVFLAGSSFAQEYSMDTLNRFDSNGKKTGYWISFLDENTNPTSKANAVYYHFNYFDGGESLLYQNKRWKWKEKNPIIKNTIIKGENGNPVLIDGEIEWNHKKSKKIRQVKEKYQSGFLTYVEETVCRKDSSCDNYIYSIRNLGKYPVGLYSSGRNSRNPSLNYDKYYFIENGKAKGFKVYIKDSVLSDAPPPYSSSDEMNFYKDLLNKIDIDPSAFIAAFSGMASVEISYNRTGTMDSARVLSSPHQEYSRAMISAIQKVKPETTLNFTEGKDTTLKIEVFFYCDFSDLPKIKELKGRYKFCFYRPYHKVNPQNDHYAEAKKLFKKEEFAEAKKYISLAYRGDPLNSEILLLMGEINLALNDTSGACKAFKTGARLGCLDSAIYVKEVCP